jgi:hypothetical protein
MPLRYPLLALALLPALAAAQEGFTPFDAYAAGGPRSDVGEDAAIDAAGNVVVTGSFEGTAAFGDLSLTAADTDPNNDWQDVFVVKYDADGAALWARRAGTGVFNDFAEGVALGPDGAVYVAGYFTGVATWDGGDNPDITLTTRNDFDAFLAKYDADGDLEWVQQTGGAGQDTGRGVAVDASNNVLFAGGFTGTATFGTSTTLTSAGSDDAFLAKYTAAGALLWVRQGGGTDGDGAWNVAADIENNAYVVGTFRGVALWDGLPLQSRGFSDLFVVRYDPNGTPRWVQQVGANGFDYGRGVAVPLGGWGVYVTGSFESTILVGTDVLTSAGASDVVIARLAPLDGALVWGVRGGGTGFDIGNDLALAPTALGAAEYRLYTTGYVDGDGTFSKGPLTRAYTSHGGLDGFVTVLRDRPGNTAPIPAGAVYTLGGTNADRGWGVGASDVGNTLAGVVVTGAFRDQAQLGPRTLTSAGSNDVYVGRLIYRPNWQEDADAGDAPVASGPGGGPPTPSLAAPAPNPFRDAATLALTLPAAQVVRAEVRDALGRRVAVLHDGPLEAGTHSLTWEAADAPPGVYVVRVTTEDGPLARPVTRLR